MTVPETMVGLDLGTTKICAIIAEVNENDEVQVVGVGVTPSPGMRRGVVVNIEKTTEAIHEAVDLAEQMAGVKVRDVYAGIAGDHIRSINSRGVIAVSRTQSAGRNNIISGFDVERVIERAREVALPSDREILHVLPQGFTVDNETGIKDPVNITGLRLEADVHIITGQVASSENIYRCVRNAGINLKELVLEPLASSHAVLSEDEKDLGVCLIDIGGGTTDVVVFYEGSIRHTAVFGLGGQNVTRDVAMVLGIPMDSAEKLKIERGGIFAPLPDAPPINVEPVGEWKGLEVNPMDLNAIIHARMDEILRLVARELKRIELFDYLSAGVVITGGASLLKGTTRLAEEIFHRPVRIGYPKGLDGLADSIHSPMYATGVGLILYALHDRALAQTVVRTRKSAFSGVFSSLRGMFEGLIA
jgi:cell division protein FtsA